jgi:aminoglycoside phosphotransferase (APT) family kinase protein
MAKSSPSGEEAGHSFRPDSETAPLDRERLAAWLCSIGLALDPCGPVRQFASGLANLNYLIRAGGRDLVLRRPPPGELPPGAHDMAREHRVLSRLGDAFPLAPRSLHLCQDKAIIGVPFQIIEYRAGTVIKGDDRTRLADPAVCRRIGLTMIETLARLHGVDAAAIGLGDFGKPEGFTRRQIAGWKTRAERIADPQTRVLTNGIVAWLEAQPLRQRQPVLLHCDVKLDNMILDARSLAPVAVVDWDQSTRGDPLFDLATTLSYWTEPSDPPAMHRMGQMPTTAAGFLSRAEAVAEYARFTGTDISDFPVYRVLAMLKLSVVFLQLHQLWVRGATRDQRYAGFGALARDLLEMTHDIIRGKVG